MIEEKSRENEMPESLPAGQAGPEELPDGDTANTESVSPNEEPQTINYKLQTEVMEVHHHPQVEKKNFKEYFLEFIMIFLAVTMGFFAESLRERIANNEKEHHYIESLVQDLKKDTAEINQVIFLQAIFIKKMDSALQVPTEKLRDINFQDSFYHHFVIFYSFDILFVPHDKTLTQLKNAGGFGVIKNDAVVDSIGELNVFYDQRVKFDGNYYLEYENRTIDLGTQLMKMSALNNLDDIHTQGYLHHVEVFTRYDRPLIGQLYSWIRNLQACLIVYMNEEKEYREREISMIKLINKEYHLENH